MLSRSLANSIKPTGKKLVGTSATTISLLRFNSSSSSSSSQPFNKQFQTSFQNFIKTAKLDKEGNFIKEQANESDYNDSALNKFVIKSIKERDELIERKLKELALENDVKFEDLKNQFDEKVKLNLQLNQRENDQIYSTISNFTHQLKSNFDSNTFWNELIDGLYPFADNLHSSNAFNYIKSIDNIFAEALSNIIIRTPTESSVAKLESAFHSGAISKISQAQYNELKSLLSEAQSATQSGIESHDHSLPGSTEEFGEVDGETVMSTIFASLNMYEDINKSPLMNLIKEIDSSFGELIINYSKIDPENDAELENSLKEIIKYCSNKDSIIYKAFGDPASPDFSKVKTILDQPLPIDLGEIYEIFETYPDYFNCDAFKAIERIDPKFGNLLKELESVPEGEQLDAKNAEVDEYLSNEQTPIYIAMNDVNSPLFNDLRSSLDKEWEILDSTVTTDKIIEYVSHNGVDSDGFKLINKIDNQFASLISDLFVEQDNEKAMEVYTKIQKYLDEPNSINLVLSERDSLNYKLLSDIIIPKNEEEITIENNEEVQVTSPAQTLNELDHLKSEDQSQLNPQVVEMNKMYDLTIDVINELQQELENNTFIPPSRSIESSLDKLLGFQPSKEQVDAARGLKERPAPKHNDEVLELCVNIIMKDGKKEVAKKNLNRTLYLLFLETRKNPVQLLKDALDMAAPLVITKTVKTGFAKNFTVPVPLTQRQRDRMALKWILDSCESKASNDFPVRLCEEILFVLTGKSKLMDKRVLSHKMAIANRSYLKI